MQRGLRVLRHEDSLWERRKQVPSYTPGLLGGYKICPYNPLVAVIHPMCVTTPPPRVHTLLAMGSVGNPTRLKTTSHFCAAHERKELRRST